jgi:hypothetical protein
MVQENEGTTNWNDSKEQVQIGIILNIVAVNWATEPAEKFSL